MLQHVQLLPCYVQNFWFQTNSATARSIVENMMCDCMLNLAQGCVIDGNSNSR